nr:ATP-dependent RecD-like DNA helicase [uncultured Oribacterium sp.]
MMTSSPEEIEGNVSHIVFRSEETGYTVCSITDKGEEFTLVGSFSHISVSEKIKAKGRWKEHPVYGKQFSVEEYQLEIPDSLFGIEQYLASGAIKGIGKAIAARIVKKFKEDSLRIMEEEPERLAEIHGISMQKAMDIATNLSGQREQQDIFLLLQGYGISLNLSYKIYQHFQGETLRVLQENPYRIAEELEGVGFKKCDELAKKVGVEKESPFRMRAGINYTLLQGEWHGHCYLPFSILKREAERILEMPLEDLEEQLLELQLQGKVKVKGENVYRAGTYYREMRVASRLLQLNVEEEEAHVDSWEKAIDRLLDREKITLDPLQRKAVSLAASSGVLVITGGPGTGKTTTIKTILQLFTGQGKSIALAAPTGRAAKRMGEATDYPAKTLHRLLEYMGREDQEQEDRDFSLFQRNEENPLEYDVLIVDEMSMVDLYLMDALLRAVPVGCRLILVGDSEQLPSVGAGNVLKDIIASQCMKTISLKKIFRQAMESDIVVNAHKINQGIEPDLGKKSGDFFFIRGQEPKQILENIAILMKEKLPKYLSTDPLSIQVMSPQKKGLLGVENLNRFLQERLNPPGKNKPEYEGSGNIFRLGDKVMQIKNDYQLAWEIPGNFNLPIESGEGVFNGDIGKITEINAYQKTLTVFFEEKKVVYSFQDLENLELAYAITIHKSQGSEYPAVLLPMYPGPKMLMSRNILYTAITRAKSCVCLLGQPKVFLEMLHNEQELKRYSGLAKQLQDIGESFSAAFSMEGGNPFSEE